MPYRDPEDWKHWNRRRHAANTEFLLAAKATPCADCGGSFPHYVMEFDHVPERGTKKTSIGAICGSRKMTAKTVKVEMAKCDLVCANCHKIRTHERGQLQRRSKGLLETRV